MSVPLPGERVWVEFGSMSSVNLRISANICSKQHNPVTNKHQKSWLEYHSLMLGGHRKSANWTGWAWMHDLCFWPDSYNVLGIIGYKSPVPLRFCPSQISRLPRPTRVSNVLKGPRQRFWTEYGIIKMTRGASRIRAAARRRRRPLPAHIKTEPRSAPKSQVNDMHTFRNVAAFACPPASLYDGAPPLDRLGFSFCSGCL
jgi:hypothetical protein